MFGAAPNDVMHKPRLLTDCRVGRYSEAVVVPQDMFDMKDNAGSCVEVDCADASQDLPS